MLAQDVTLTIVYAAMLAAMRVYVVSRHMILFSPMRALATRAEIFTMPRHTATLLRRLMPPLCRQMPMLRQLDYDFSCCRLPLPTARARQR